MAFSLRGYDYVSKGTFALPLHLGQILAAKRTRRPRSQLFLLFLAMINKRGNDVMQMPAICFRHSAEFPACSPKSRFHGLPVSV